MVFRICLWILRKELEREEDPKVSSLENSDGEEEDPAKMAVDKAS